MKFTTIHFGPGLEKTDQVQEYFFVIRLGILTWIIYLILVVMTL